MILYPNSIMMTDRHREIVQSQEKDFPYTAMEASLNLYAGKSTPWHWHDHFEMAIVLYGRVEVFSQQGSVILHPGEGYFLNANVLHMSRAVDQNACLRAQLFTRELISGTGLVTRRYISTVENCPNIVMQILKPENPAHRDILNEFSAAFVAAEGDVSGHEILICAHIAAAWGGLFRQLEDKILNSHGAPREDVLRAKAMLNYIHENYVHPVSVRQIASAAGICERECFRCFAEILDTTPMICLNRHRIGIAARALAETSLPIARIAEDCGFSSSGYFGKVFRQMMGCTPSEYRKNR